MQQREEQFLAAFRPLVHQKAVAAGCPDIVERQPEVADLATLAALLA